MPQDNLNTPVPEKVRRAFRMAWAQAFPNMALHGWAFDEHQPVARLTPPVFGLGVEWHWNERLKTAAEKRVGHGKGLLAAFYTDPRQEAKADAYADQMEHLRDMFRHSAEGVLLRIKPPADTKIHYMDLSEFVETGYLQELNRCFLHPLGLALEAVAEDDNTLTRLGGIWDYRHDPEGIAFFKVNREKAERVIALMRERAPEREKRLGYIIQPLEEPKHVEQDGAEASGGDHDQNPQGTEGAGGAGGGPGAEGTGGDRGGAGD